MASDIAHVIAIVLMAQCAYEFIRILKDHDMGRIPRPFGQAALCSRGSNHAFTPCPGKELCKWEFGPHPWCHFPADIGWGGPEPCHGDPIDVTTYSTPMHEHIDYSLNSSARRPFAAIADLARAIGISVTSHPKIEHPYIPDFEICKEFPGNCMSPGKCHHIIATDQYDSNWHLCGQLKELHTWKQESTSTTKRSGIWSWVKRVIKTTPST